MSRVLIPTGISLELEKGYEAQIRSRSGLSYKKGIVVLNSPGTIDADYRGEIKVILTNFSNENFAIDYGMRIAQMVIGRVELQPLFECVEISTSVRGEGGFG